MYRNILSWELTALDSQIKTSTWRILYFSIISVIVLFNFQIALKEDYYGNNRIYS